VAIGAGTSGRRLLLCCRRDVVKVDVPAIVAVRIAPAGEDGHRRI
jgi:hypothetical protein